jgi:hypothetical protein
MHPSAYIAVEDSQWPLLTVRFIGEPSTQQVLEYLERMTGYLARGEPHVVLYDARRTTATGPAVQRQLQAAWIVRNEQRIRALQLGKVFLFTSPLVRLSVGVVFHLKPPPNPYFITPRLDEALAWACGQLEAGGLKQEAARLREQHGLTAVPPRVG